MYDTKTRTPRCVNISLREVVRRRYRRAAEGEELYPDIILTGGGLGQLHAALEAVSEAFVKPPMVISLAKREEEIYIQARNRPIKLARNDAALRVLSQVRDEAHRFVQHYHHILRTKRQFDEDIKAGKRPPRRARATPVTPGDSPAQRRAKRKKNREVRDERSVNSIPLEVIQPTPKIDPFPEEDVQRHPEE